MREIRILHTADIHLDRRFRGFGGLKGTKRRLEIQDRFVHVMETAQKEKVHVVLIAGDLFDNNNPSPGTVGIVRERFEILGRNGIQVLISPGTHDCNDGNSIWNREDFPENVHVFKSPVLTGRNMPGINLTVFGAANDTSNSDRHPLRDVKLDMENSCGNKIIMAHGSVPVPWAVNDSYFPISEEEINLTEVDYVALGHYHSYYPFNTRIKAAYPGSPVLLDFEENKEKYALLVRISGSEVSIDPVKVEQKYEMSETDIECANILTGEDLIGKLKPLASGNKILRVKLKGSPAINADIDSILSRASEYFEEEKTFFHVLWKNQTRIPRRTMPDENTVRGIFIKKLTEKIDSLPEEEKMKYEIALHLGVRALDEGKL